MSSRLSDLFKEREAGNDVSDSVERYGSTFTEDNQHDPEAWVRDPGGVSKLYYDLVTDLFEYGWGRSFHFAHRNPDETFPESLARHERFMASKLDLRSGMKVLDLGCGVGGPQREIVRFSGAKVVGVNNNPYQVERARKLTGKAGLTHLTDYFVCDFMDVPDQDGSYDAVFSIEASCCAPDKVGVYGEVFRLLKPGGCFGAYEYCMTDRYDPDDARHQRIKSDLEYGGGLHGVAYPVEIDTALREAGFEILETCDLADDPGPGLPWYEPLAGSGISMARLRSSNLRRWFTHHTLEVTEMLRIVPRGTAEVSNMLNTAARAFVEAGRLGIFTPMYFLLARKSR